jgi:hypothetical protein
MTGKAKEEVIDEDDDMMSYWYETSFNWNSTI